MLPCTFSTRLLYSVILQISMNGHVRFLLMYVQREVEEASQGQRSGSFTLRKLLLPLPQLKENHLQDHALYSRISTAATGHSILATTLYTPPHPENTTPHLSRSKNKRKPETAKPFPPKPNIILSEKNLVCKAVLPSR
jgi:hypothetical protein